VATFYSLSGTEYAYFHGVNYTDVRPDGSEVMITGDSILTHPLLLLLFTDVPPGTTTRLVTGSTF
jgi:hypothetical protein